MELLKYSTNDNSMSWSVWPGNLGKKYPISKSKWPKWEKVVLFQNLPKILHNFGLLFPKIIAKDFKKIIKSGHTDVDEVFLVVKSHFVAENKS